MANWLESLEDFATGIIDAGGEAVAGKIKKEINPDAPKNPADRPETQFDTKIQQPIDGPETVRKTGNGLDNAWVQYKWWIVGGLGVVAVAAMIGRR